MAAKDENRVRIILWNVPRTVSAAFTKCLTAIEGMEVWFESFSYCGMARRTYQEKYGEDIPMEYKGNEEKVEKAAKLFEGYVGSKIEPERIVYGNVKRMFEESNSRYIIAKDFFEAFPDEKARQYLPSGFRHVFIIRDPYRVFSSYRRALYGHLTNVGMRSGDVVDQESFDLRKDDPSIDPNKMFIGLYEIWKYLQESVDPIPIVVNTDDLLANPSDVLSKFCQLTGLPYSDSLLNWDASPDIVKTWHAAGDNVVMDVKAFYETAIYSSRFLPLKPPMSMGNLTPDVQELADKSMPYFQEMNSFKI